jgi:hypothetical protein
VAIALLGPPAGKGEVIGQAHPRQPLQGGVDQLVVGSRALQAAPQLPLRAGTGGQEARRDLERRVAVWRRAIRAAATALR